METPTEDGRISVHAARKFGAFLDEEIGGSAELGNEFSVSVKLRTIRICLVLSPPRSPAVRVRLQYEIVAR